MKPACLVFVLVVVSGRLIADDKSADLPPVADNRNELQQALSPAVKQLAHAARRQKHQRVLLLTRERAGSRTPRTSADLAQLHKQLTRALQGQDIEVVESAEALNVLPERSATPLLPPAHVAELQAKMMFDALVTADVANANGETVVRLALTDSERRLFVRTLEIANALLATLAVELGEPGTNTITAPPAGTGTGLGTATTDAAAFGNAPPLCKGPSAYRKLLGPRDGFGPRRHKGGGPKMPKEKCDDPMSDDETTDDGESTDDDAPDETTDETDQTPEPTELNMRIVSFAASHLGEQVGNGECWTLAAEALRAAGAEPPDRYDFGTEIPLDQIVPGDILQFKSARFDIPNGYILMGLPNHTAIVYNIDGDRVFVLHQNFGGQIVSILDINFDNMTEGTVQPNRAVEATASAMARDVRRSGGRGAGGHP